MITRQKIDYYLLSETVVDPELAMKTREVLHENVIPTAGGGKLFTITYKQCLQSCGVSHRNWNGRIYTKDVVSKSLDTNPLIQNDIKMHTWTAEYGHPIIEKGMNELARQMTIFPPNACNTIDKYWWEGDMLMGECTTLSGGYGDLVRDRILTNYPAMASSRAVGGVDKTGTVLPGYTIVTYDTVIRPSHKEAYKVDGSEKVNDFNVPSGNSMTESAVSYDFTKDAGFKDFLLTESVSKSQINMVCDTFNLDYDTMVITESAVKISRTAEGNRETIVMPLNSLINAEYYNLF